MPFLRDEEIAALVRGTPSLASGVDGSVYNTKDSAIQACSLDLTIGEILDPGAKAGDPGSHGNSLQELVLCQGATAVIRTGEALLMPPDIGGIAFPPAHVSIKGLLMTNPGHVDPGYSGHLHLTVINMGKKSYPLKRGERIARVLLFKLDAAPAADYASRHPRQGASPLTAELLSRLSEDFLDVTKRATDVADKRVNAAQWRVAIGVPLAVVVLTWFGGWVSNIMSDKLEHRISVLETRVNDLGGDVDLGSIDNRLSVLENEQSDDDSVANAIGNTK